MKQHILKGVFTTNRSAHNQDSILLPSLIDSMAKLSIINYCNSYFKQKGYHFIRSKVVIDVQLSSEYTKQSQKWIFLRSMVQYWDFWRGAILTFSWSMWLRSFISLNVLFASITLSNAFPIFLIATSSRVSEFIAALHASN